LKKLRVVHDASETTKSESTVEVEMKEAKEEAKEETDEKQTPTTNENDDEMNNVYIQTSETN